MKFSLGMFACLVATAAAAKFPVWYQNTTNQKPGRFLLIEKNDKYGFLDLEDRTIQLQASLSDITYYVYSRDNLNLPCIIKNNDLLSLINCPNFDAYKRTLFIIHGWNNNYQSKVNTLIKSAALENEDINVIVVDWSRPANSIYFTAISAIPDIGEYVGEFIDTIVQAFEIDFDKITLVGHSLGAHVASCAGRVTKGLLGLIVGLDPAGPLIDFDNTENSLDASDAKYVQAIHTCAGLLGTVYSVGHSDYWPNGGDVQPGCGLDLTGSCAHGRSYEYYAESILTSNFMSRKCDSYDSYVYGLCADHEKSFMGTYEVDNTARGNYVLLTNSDEPFALG